MPRSVKSRIYQYIVRQKGTDCDFVGHFSSILAYFRALKSLFSVDRVGIACRQSQNSRLSRHCRDRLSTTALVNTECPMHEFSKMLFGINFHWNILPHIKFPIYPIILPGVATRVSFDQRSVLSTTLSLDLERWIVSDIHNVGPFAATSVHSEIVAVCRVSNI